MDLLVQVRWPEGKKVKLWKADFVTNRGETMRNEFDQNSDICIGRVKLGRHFKLTPIHTYIHTSSYLTENTLSP